MTTRQMIRNCGFYTSDGKNFSKSLNRSYQLKAILLTRKGVHLVKIEKYFNGILRDSQEFIENSDFSLMEKYCSTQTF